MVREFVENEVKPIMQEIDEEERFPSEIWAKLGPAGLLGIQYPKKYGGQGGDYLAYIIAIGNLQVLCIGNIRYSSSLFTLYMAYLPVRY